MARVFDEKLESGYEESGGTTTTGSATLDPNTAVSAAGSPSGWGSYCLYADADPDGAAYRYYNPTFPTTFYFRDEVVIDSHALVNDNDQATFAYVGANASTAAFILFIRKVSGSIKFMARITTSATHVDYYSDNAISLGTRYRIEVKYDIDNDQWEWRVDGVTQDSGTLATGHPTTLGHMRIGANPVANKAIAVYHDNVAIDNADWVGEEVSTIAAAASDGVTAGDTSGATARYPVASLDGITVSDSSVISTVFQALASDGVVLSDTASKALFIVADAADSVVVSDVNGLRIDFIATAQDGVTVSDVASTISNMLAAVAEGINLSDAAVSTDGGLPDGTVTVTLTASKATISFTVKKPEINITGKKPGITFI